MTHSILSQHPAPLEPDYGGVPVEGEPGGSFDLQEKVLFALGRHRWLVGAAIAIGLIGGLVVAAGSPNVFTSRARLRLQSGKIENLSSEEIMGVETDSRSSHGVIDEVFLLQVEDIYRRVAADLGPQLILTPADPTEHDDEETPAHLRSLHNIQKFLFDRSFKPHCNDASCESCLHDATIHLLAHTDVIPEKGSSVISIYHTGFSPVLAQAAADAVVKASVEKHREKFNVSNFVGLNRDSLESTRQLLEEARQDFEEHTEGCKVVEIELETSSLLTAEAERRQQLGEHVSNLKAVEAKIRMYEGQLEAMPVTIDEVTPAEIAANPAYTKINERIVNLTEELVMLDADLTVTNKNKAGRRDALARLVERGEEELANTDPTIVTIPERVITIPNRSRIEYEEKVIDLQAEQRGLIALIEDLQTSLEQSESRLDQLRVCQPIHARHRSEINSAESVYQKLANKNAEVEALAMLDVQPEANLSVWENAKLPVDKDGPRRSKFVLMGLFGGTALGCAIAVLLQLLDSRVRYPKTVEKALGLPLLGVVPEVRSLRRFSPPRSAA